jgi:hypothetical protein
VYRRNRAYMQIVLALRMSNEMDLGRHIDVVCAVIAVLFVHDVFGGG